MDKLVKFQFNLNTKFWAAILCSFFVLGSYGQSFDDVVSSNKYIDCKDVSYNAASIISEAYSNNQTNRIYEFLDYWESKCGNLEVVNRIRTILDINDGKFLTKTFSQETIGNLIFYRSSLNPFDNIQGRKNYFSEDYYQSLASIDDLSKEMASNSRASTLDGELILDFYSAEEPSFSKIKNVGNSSELKELHNETYNKTLRMWQWHYAFITGAIQNYGNISLFGIRPNFGFAFGAKSLRHNLDVVLDFRAGPSDEDYTFIYQGDLLEDDTWTGVYIGFEYTYDFINTKKFDVGISPGLGYDNITAVSGDEDSGDDSKFLPSFNRNIGLVFKYKYGQKGGYLGLHFRYNWADYNNPGGTRLDGEYLNIRLTIGNIFNSYRNFRLQNLE